MGPYWIMGFPDGSDSKESTCNAGDLGLIPGLGRSPGEGHGNQLQYYCLRAAWQAAVHILECENKKSRTNNNGGHY